MRQVVVMVTTSYPRFEGDSVGTFMDPIAHSVAARGHDVHVVAPWHPLVARPAEERGVHLHFYRYAPVPSLNVFGYAASMRADVSLRGAAYAAAPLALMAGWHAARQIARRHHATVMHGHWVVPGGVTAALAAPTLPLVVSLHGSDVYVAETLAPARAAARQTFRRAGYVTACSDDLRRRAIALGAAPDRIETVPYGVDVERFRPDALVRNTRRAELAIEERTPLVFAAGRLVRKKGFEYLIDAMAALPDAVLALAGQGSLDGELRDRARQAGIAARVRFLGNLTQTEVGELLAAADVVCVPSVRDDSGNVDGLPNVLMEALASGTPVVTTAAGGIQSVVTDGVTGMIVAERDSAALGRALGWLIAHPAEAQRIGVAARAAVAQRFGWSRAAAAFEAAYARALAFKSSRS
jgi:glycosyltransferase involved in cell wall biosynthesis